MTGTGLSHKLFKLLSSIIAYKYTLFFCFHNEIRFFFVTLPLKMTMRTEELYSYFQKSSGVTTDTRSCREGTMFFALRGERFNGNQYAQAALEAGCTYAVVDDRDVYDASNPRLLFVDNTLKALQALARYHRRQLGLPIIGITGTNGKTTTKELIAAVLSRKFRTHFTQGNLNNSIGVPLTLLQLSHKHELAVVEMGASHPGDIRELVEIAEPDCGLITNVGRAHLEGFGSFEGVIHTKGELYDFLREREGGFVFLNDNDPILKDLAKGLRTCCYGTGEKQEGRLVYGEVLDCNPYLSFRWSTTDEHGRDVQTQLVGRYNIDNVLCAAAVGTHFGVSPDDINEAIRSYKPTNSRSQLLKTEHNTLIVDAYNANPTSMKAALENFAQIEGEKKMVILGEMKELGEASEEEHLAILQLLSTLDFQQVWTIGHNFSNALFPFRNFENVEAAIQAVQAERPEGMTVLIKGSNSVHLPQLIPHL